MRHKSMAHRRLGFQIHAIVFVVAMVILLAINMMTGAPFWVVWVLASWGIGLVAHWFFKLGPAARIGTG